MDNSAHNIICNDLHKDQMTPRKLRVLLVEASPVDAAYVLAKLAQSGYEIEHERVDNAPAMRAALNNHSETEDKLDVILCNYGSSAFGGLDALQLLQSTNVDLPFLFLSTDLREESIIHAMRSGADDYIIRDSLDRLTSAIEHNLREARIRREHRHAQLALQDNQERLRNFIANLPGMAYQLLLTPHGRISFPYVSEGSQSLLGVDPQDLERDPFLFLRLLHPDDRASYEHSMLSSAKHLAFWNWEGRIIMPTTGETKWVNLRCSPRKMNNGDIRWEGIMSNITQGKLAEIEVMRSQEQLRELSEHIQEVREQERLNVAREVHDNLGSLLIAIKLDIAYLSGHLTNQHPELADKTKSIEMLVEKCIASANDIARSLRPSELDSFGLIAAIEIEAKEFEKRTGISCVVQHVDEVGTENHGDINNPDTPIALFRIFQETLANIMKHAQATHVEISITSRIDSVDLIVRDNGRGISDSDRRKPHSFGLRGIEERVAHFNGKVVISSTPGQGVTVSVHIPTHAMSSILQQQPLFP